MTLQRSGPTWTASYNWFSRVAICSRQTRKEEKGRSEYPQQVPASASKTEKKEEDKVKEEESDEEEDHFEEAREE